jgi:nucleoside-diphosphate-sugar epimerase
MKEILITGAHSFVGTNFIAHSKNMVVREVSLIENHPRDINFEGVDVVLHLAAIVHQSKKTPKSEYFAINRDLCLEVASFAKKGGVKHFIFLSTFKVYGDIIPDSVVLNEESSCFPTDAYGKSKFEAEMGLIKMEEPGFIISIIRTPLVYGVGVKANMLSLIKLVDTFPILPFGELSNFRCYTFVENLVGFIDRIIDKRASGVFITMDKTPLSTTELVRMISENLGKRVYLLKVPKFLLKMAEHTIPGIYNRLYGSFKSENKRTLEILDFEPPFSSEEGICKMIDSYKLAKMVTKKTGGD